MLRPARKMVGLGVPSSNKLKAGDEIDDQVRAIKVRDQLELDDVSDDDSDEELEENE